MLQPACRLSLQYLSALYMQNSELYASGHICQGERQRCARHFTCPKAVCNPPQGAAPTGDVTSAKSRAEHLAPLATALFRVKVWAANNLVKQVVAAYLTVLGLDSAAQEELSAATREKLMRAVCHCFLLSLQKVSYIECHGSIT